MLESLVWLLVGGAFLVLGGEVLVRGASGIARLCRISPLIIGLTIVAACTSAPEMAVSLMGALNGSDDVALGNVVGSNIANILLILGLTALICPIAVSSRLIRREIPMMIGISALTLLFSCVLCRGVEGAPDFHLFPRWGGGIFLILYFAYNFWILRTIHSDQDQKITDSLQENFQPRPAGSVFMQVSGFGTMLVLGLGMLVFGADRFIFGGVKLAEILGVSQLVISLTILAVGTSLPELVVSCVAAFRGKCDIAVGNLVGSNIFNLLAALGLSASIHPVGLLMEDSVFRFDLPVMLGSACVTALFCFTGRWLSRTEGVVLLLIYGGYLAFLVLR